MRAPKRLDLEMLEKVTIKNNLMYWDTYATREERFKYRNKLKELKGQVNGEIYRIVSQIKNDFFVN